MKTHLYRSILLAAGLMAAAAVGSAQTLNATIPFNFQSGASQMPAGDYVVRQLLPGSGIIVMSNWAAKKSIAVMASNRIGSVHPGDPRLIFRCTDNRCALSEVWGAMPDGDGVRVPGPKLTPRDRERLSVVYLERKSGDH